MTIFIDADESLADDIAVRLAKWHKINCIQD